MKIVTVEQMRQAEQNCEDAGISTAALMENAGKAVAEETRRILGDVAQKVIVVLVGPGNNGGDGLVAARYLHDWGAILGVYLLGQRTPEDANLKLIQERKIPLIYAENDENQTRLSELLIIADAAIDAIFGTGKVRPLSGVFAQSLAKLNAIKKNRPALKIIALDLPSGLNADTGAVDPATPFADYTVSLGFPKVGFFNFPGIERLGRYSIVDIGIPADFVQDSKQELIDVRLVKSLLPVRPSYANKGTFGKALVVSGSINYIGAAYLVCSAAMRVGAGLVTLSTARYIQSILAAKLTEVIYLPLPEDRPGIVSHVAAKTIKEQIGVYNTMLVGPGLGQNQSVKDFIIHLLFKLKVKLPRLILDADALNTLAQVPKWWRRLHDDAVLTPHPGEMSRLARMSLEGINAARLEVARKFAQEWNKTVVLKGAYTVIAAPDGRLRVSPFANPGLASAGTGDVLSGAITGLMSQGLSCFDAATLGVYLHGEAGERVRARLGDTGMLASDLLPELPLVIKTLREA